MPLNFLERPQRKMETLDIQNGSKNRISNSTFFGIIMQKKSKILFETICSDVPMGKVIDNCV